MLLVLAMGAAIFFWGRGLRKGCKRDLIAGPGVIVALCVTLLALNDTTFVFEKLGGILAVFGLAVAVSSAWVREGGVLAKRDVLSIGIATIVLGLILSMIL